MILDLPKMVRNFDQHDWEVLRSTTKYYVAGKHKDKPFQSTFRRKCKCCNFVLKIEFNVDHEQTPPSLDWKVLEHPGLCKNEKMVLN
jgi:hypothetical protein